jgi:hypothetical protein
VCSSDLNPERVAAFDRNGSGLPKTCAVLQPFQG